MKKVYIIQSLLILILLPVFLLAGKEEPDTFQKAEKYFFQKKYGMAEILLQQVLKENPENARAYSYLGDIFLDKKRYDGALNMYQKAIDIEPGNAENYFRLGQIYYYKNLGLTSIDYFQRAVSLDKSLKFAYYHIGLSYLMLERDKNNTIKYWETFLRKAPEDPQYEKIKRVIELLKDPNFVIPPKGSEISVEEALLLGGSTLEKVDREAENKKAGHEKKKTKKKIEGLYLDDEL